MTIKERELEKRLKQLTQHISRMRKKLREHNLWLMGGFNALVEPSDEAQQGPMINKLYEMVDDNKKYLRDL